MSDSDSISDTDSVNRFYMHRMLAETYEILNRKTDPVLQEGITVNEVDSKKKKTKKKKKCKKKNWQQLDPTVLDSENQKLVDCPEPTTETTDQLGPRKWIEKVHPSPFHPEQNEPRFGRQYPGSERNSAFQKKPTYAPRNLLLESEPTVPEHLTTKRDQFGRGNRIKRGHLTPFHPELSKPLYGNQFPGNRFLQKRGSYRTAFLNTEPTFSESMHQKPSDRPELDQLGPRKWIKKNPVIQLNPESPAFETQYPRLDQNRKKHLTPKNPILDKIKQFKPVPLISHSFENFESTKTESEIGQDGPEEFSNFNATHFQSKPSIRKKEEYVLCTAGPPGSHGIPKWDMYKIRKRNEM